MQLCDKVKNSKRDPLCVSDLLVQVLVQRGLVQAGQVGLMEVQVLLRLAVLQAALSQTHGLLHPLTGPQVTDPQLEEDRQL